MHRKVTRLATRRRTSNPVERDLGEGITPRVVAFPRSVHVKAVRYLAEDCHRLSLEPARREALLADNVARYQATMIGRGVEPAEAADRASEFRRRVEGMIAQIDVAVDVLITHRAAELVTRGYPESCAERRAQRNAQREIGSAKGWSLKIEEAIARMADSTGGNTA